MFMYYENRFNLATSHQSGFDVVSRFWNDKRMAKVLSVHKSSVSISGKKRIIGIRHCVYIVDCIHTFAVMQPLLLLVLKSVRTLNFAVSNL